MKEPIRGRGAGHNPHNRFAQYQHVREHPEGLDAPEDSAPATEFIPVRAKTIVNQVESPDVGMAFSLNPYQGCEHGCAYCYARPTHEYWGYSAGTDFESRILVKPDAPRLLEAFLNKPTWKPFPIALSGNTDCYQPIERKLRLTRQLLEVMLRYRHPVGIITKNALVLRDLDILQPLAEQRLVHVYISLTTLVPTLRRVLEPRTSTPTQRLKAIEELTKAGVPTGVMAAPIIPGLNDHELPNLLAAAAEAGAQAAGYTVVRLNGAVGEVFRTWLETHYPERAQKVLRYVAEAHGGRINDSKFGRRMVGEGPTAENIRRMFRLYRMKHFGIRTLPPYNLNAFCPPKGTQGNLFAAE
jgi:DNA repair photolyase